MNDKKIISTGIATLDKTIMGFYPANLIVVGGRPGMGKSTFMLNVAHHIACSKKHKVAIFSLEMSKEEIQKHLLACEAQISIFTIRSGDLTAHEQARLKDASDVLRDAPIVIEDTPAITVSEIKEKLQQMEDVDIVFIDYLQLMGNSSRSPLEYAEISRELKMMAKEMNIPIVVLSQLPRANTGRVDNRPILNDLRNYETVLQDSDLVLFLYRDEYYRKTDNAALQEKDPITEIIVAKNRNGEIGTVNVYFNSEFESYSHLSDENGSCE